MPLQNAFLQVQVDEQGHTTSILISLPLLRPEIVKAVRGAKVTPDQAKAAIAGDVKTLPEDNQMRIHPHAKIDWTRAKMQKMVNPVQPPYVTYVYQLGIARYTVDATTGKVIDKVATVLDDDMVIRPPKRVDE